MRDGMSQNDWEHPVLAGMALFLVVLLAVDCALDRKAPKSESLSMSGEPRTVAELEAEVELLKMRTGVRDDAIDLLLWQAEGRSAECCHPCGGGL